MQTSKAELIREIDELRHRQSEVESRVKEHMDAEQELQRMVAERDAIFDVFPDLYFRLSSDHTILEYRAEKEQDLFLPPQQFLGKKVAEVMPAAVTDLYFNGLRQLVEERKSAGFQYVLTVNGQERYFEARLVALTDSEIAVCVRNITDYVSVEAALRVSEARYKELADSITDIFFALDHDLKYTYWNNASEKLTGIMSRDAIGKSIYEIFPDIDNTAIERNYLSALKTRKPHVFENRYSLNGSEYNFEFSVYPTAHGLSVFVRDISERRESEEALRASEAKFRAIFDESATGMAIIDVSGAFIDVNPALQRFLGYSRSELLHLSFSDVTHPDDINSDHTPFYEVVRGKRRHCETEGRYLDKDGQVVWGHMTLFSIGAGETKTHIAVGMIEDINRRKLAEEELRQSEARYRAVIETAFDDLVLTVNGIIFEAPGHMPRLLGYSPSEVIGKPILNFIAPEDLDLVRRNMTQDSDNRYEYHLLAKDGSRVAVEVSSKSVPYHGWRAKITAMRDITYRKVMEREREQLIQELQNALTNIKTLRGLLPICAHCKKIRDDHGYWSQLETYIAKHSDAHFTHGLCPECAKEHYPEYFSSPEEQPPKEQS